MKYKEATMRATEENTFVLRQVGVFLENVPRRLVHVFHISGAYLAKEEIYASLA